MFIRMLYKAGLILLCFPKKQSNTSRMLIPMLGNTNVYSDFAGFAGLLAPLRTQHDSNAKYFARFPFAPKSTKVYSNFAFLVLLCASW